VFSGVVWESKSKRNREFVLLVRVRDQVKTEEEDGMAFYNNPSQTGTVGAMALASPTTIVRISDNMAYH